MESSLSRRSNDAGNNNLKNGFTFLEMLMVVVIIGILSTVAMTAIEGTLERSRFEGTVAEMNQLVQAMVGNPELYSGGVRTDFGYFGDVGGLPPNLDALMTNPGYGTWDGPYMAIDFTQNASGFKTDEWGNLYTYTGGVTIASSGGGSSITRNIANSTSDLTSNTVEGVVIDGVGNPPGTDAANVTLRITYPNGSGSMTTRTTSPNASGAFAFTNLIPVGNHQLQAIYSTTSDTSVLYLSLLPGSDAVANIRLPGNLWSEAGGSGGLTLLGGSVQTKGGGDQNVEFVVQNLSGSDISITSIRADYNHPTEVPYFEQIKIGGTKVFDDNNPRGGSGETKTFSVVVINDGADVKIEYKKFKDAQSGGGNNVDMTGTSFLITFSDGSTVSFTAP